MTEDEKSRPTLPREERELAQREAELQNERSRMYAVKAIKKPDWTTAEIRLGLVDFVLGDDGAQIDARVKAFGALVQKYVDAKVEATFLSPREESPGKGTEAELEESGIGIRAAKRYAEKIKL